MQLSGQNVPKGVLFCKLHLANACSGAKMELFKKNEAFYLEKRESVMRTRSRKRMEEIEGFVNEYTMKNHCSPSIQAIADAMGVSKSTAFYYLRDMNNLGILEYDGKEIRTKKTSKVSSGLTGAAILGSVSCGVPLLEEENVEEYVNLPISLFGNGSFFILRANGDSMTGAGIDDGDLVIVRKEEQAQEGEIVVALIDDGTTTLKRLFYDRENGQVLLHPENASMSDISVRNCRIQGVAVKVIKEL